MDATTTQGVGTRSLRSLVLIVIACAIVLSIAMVGRATQSTSTGGQNGIHCRPSDRSAKGGSRGTGPPPESQRRSTGCSGRSGALDAKVAPVSIYARTI